LKLNTPILKINVEINPDDGNKVSFRRENQRTQTVQIVAHLFQFGLFVKFLIDKDLAWVDF
jgi:hypothetical protein